MNNSVGSGEERKAFGCIWIWSCCILQRVKIPKFSFLFVTFLFYLSVFYFIHVIKLWVLCSWEQTTLQAQPKKELCLRLQILCGSSDWIPKVFSLFSAQQKKGKKYRGTQQGWKWSLFVYLGFSCSQTTFQTEFSGGTLKSCTGSPVRLKCSL